MSGREAYLTCRDLEEHRDLHGPTFFKLLPPSRFASPPEETALQVLQAKKILHGKKILQAGIREEAGRQEGSVAMGTAKFPATVNKEQLQKPPFDEDNSQQLGGPAPRRMGNSAVQVLFGQQKMQQKMNGSDQKRNGLEGTELHPTVQAKIKPIGSVAALQDRKEKGNEAERNCCSKGNPEGPFEEKVVLLSTGKSVSISVNPTLNTVAFPPSKPSTPTSGKAAETAQGTAAVESLKYDNLYSYAASGLCAVATTKRAWKYQEELGQRRLELCLEDQFNKYPKKLEFYNSIAAENRQKGNANGGEENSQSYQTGSKRHHNDLHHQDLGGRSTSTAIARAHTSHQRTSAAQAGSTIQQPPLANPGTSSQGQRLAANTQAARDVPAILDPVEAIQRAYRTSVLPANEFLVGATPTGVAIKGDKMEGGVWSDEKIVEESHLLPESSHLDSEKGCRHGVIPGRPLVASSSGGAPQSYQLANLTSGGVSSSLETVTSKAEAGSDVTVASTAAPPVAQEPLNDLDVKDAAPVTMAESTVVATESPGNAGVVCVTTVNHIEVKGAADRREDTRNDTAIARLLQFEENEQAGLPHPSTHVPGTSGSSGSYTSAEDYRLAMQMQQEWDAEMALMEQQREERERRARQYNSPFDERADRRNMPSMYDSPPTDNNANSRHHNRVYGRQEYPTYGHYQGEEEEGGDRYMWRRGLGTVVATRRDPSHAHIHEGMDMSYEALSQLKDVSRGLNPHTISRMTTIYKHEPKQDGAYTAPQDAKCCICLQDFEAGQQLRSLPCIHAFHRYCIDKWLTENKHCPVCMKNILDFAHQFV